MLVKLTQAVDESTKNNKAKCNQRKAAEETFVQKRRAKVLIKLTPGSNFINVLCTAFRCVVPKSVKKLRTSLSFLCFWAPLTLKLYVEC